MTRLSKWNGPNWPDCSNSHHRWSIVEIGLLVTVVFATRLVASAQSTSFESAFLLHSYAASGQQEESLGSSSSLFVTPSNPQVLETPRFAQKEALRWFVVGTLKPSHLAGQMFISACGTALNRPYEYGTHWDGFAERFGSGVAGSAVGNAMEAGLGLVLREDPRYFRAPDRTFKARVKHAISLTFVARRDNGSYGNAYARYIAIVGGNFLSNTWRVRSEADTQHALLRASEGFAGRMAANTFIEFTPDLKRFFFHKHNLAQASLLKPTPH